jgi:hypothetical protein
MLPGGSGAGAVAGALGTSAADGRVLTDEPPPASSLNAHARLDDSKRLRPISAILNDKANTPLT